MSISQSSNHMQTTFIVSSPKCEHAADEHDAACAFQVAWNINVHMQIGAVDVSEATFQHRCFKSALREAGANVWEVPFVHAAYDSVFVKDNALLGHRGNQGFAYLANPTCEERKAEQAARRQSLIDLGFEIVGEATEPLEGGDLVVVPRGRGAFLGYGFRSSPFASQGIEDFLGMDVTALELVDPHFYHLDTALAVLDDGSAFACRDAFSDEAWKKLKRSHSISRLTEVSRDEALRFALNWVEVDDTVVIGSFAPGLTDRLHSLGKRVCVTPLQQFQYAGGSAACLTTRVHQLV